MHSNYEATSSLSPAKGTRERERESCGVQSRVNDGIVPVHPRLHVYKLSNLAGESVPGPLFVPADRSTRKKMDDTHFPRSLRFLSFFHSAVSICRCRKKFRERERERGRESFRGLKDEKVAYPMLWTATKPQIKLASCRTSGGRARKRGCPLFNPA